MSKHAKNNSARHYFTSWERAEMGYGTTTQRMTAAAIKDWDACCLCLQTAIHPMLCPEGHLYCKECIFQSILTQKEEQSRQQQLYNDQQARLEREARDREVMQQEAAARQFELTETSIVREQIQVFTHKPGDDEKRVKPPPTHALASDYVPSGNIFYDNKTKQEARERESKVAELSGHKEAAKEVPLGHNFWLASNTPTAAPDLVAKPSSDTTCPEGAHKLKAKQLIKLDFTPLPNEDTTVLSATRYMCQCCSRTLTNTFRAAAMKRCGHVVCAKCAAEFVVKDQKCFVCSTPCMERDIVLMQQGGTGFAATNQLEAKKYKTTALV